MKKFDSQKVKSYCQKNVSKVKKEKKISSIRSEIEIGQMQVMQIQTSRWSKGLKMQILSH